MKHQPYGYGQNEPLWRTRQGPTGLLLKKVFPCQTAPGAQEIPKENERLRNGPEAAILGGIGGTGGRLQYR